MSNLGAYQTMTTTAKRLGGPYGLTATVLAIGYVGGKLIEVPIRVAIKHIRKKKNPRNSEKMIAVTSAGSDGSGLTFSQGDAYRVLYSDIDMALIEKIGDTNNPYMVSLDFLRSVSNYEYASVISKTGYGKHLVKSIAKSKETT